MRDERTPGPLRLADGRALPDEGHAPIRSADFPFLLDDGSRLDAVRSPSLSVIENEAARFLLQLDRGAVRFEVTPGGPRRWVIETELATVEVVGTVFELDRTDTGLNVRVEHGIVLVRGEQVPGRMRRLSAGEALHLDAPAPPAAAARASPGEAGPPAVSSAADHGDPPVKSRRPRDLEPLLDELELLRRAGRKEASRQFLRTELSQARPRGERATLLVTLAQWTSDDGEDAAAAALLAGLAPEGLPHELVRAARRLEASCWRRAGRPAEAEEAERRLSDHDHTSTDR
jgi:transmembrane sensor